MLADYELPTKTVEIDAANSFTVRGLDFSDLVRLTHRHGPILGILYSRVIEIRDHGGEKLTPEGLGGMIAAAAAEFPDLVADLIATAAGEPGQVDKVRKLRFPVQMDAIHQIIGLTFVGEHELKKLMEIVTEAAEATTRTLKSVTNPKLLKPSPNGSGTSASA